MEREPLKDLPNVFAVAIADECDPLVLFEVDIILEGDKEKLVGILREAMNRHPEIVDLLMTAVVGDMELVRKRRTK
jgi:hypothetical protein